MLSARAGSCQWRPLTRVYWYTEPIPSPRCRSVDNELSLGRGKPTGCLTHDPAPRRDQNGGVGELPGQNGQVSPQEHDASPYYTSLMVGKPKKVGHVDYFQREDPAWLTASFLSLWVESNPGLSCSGARVCIAWLCTVLPRLPALA